MPNKQDDEDYDNDKELKKSHTTTTKKKKQRLIEFVIKHNMSIYRAAKRLDICQPTAKLILKNYRLAHNIPKKATGPLPACKQQAQQAIKVERQQEQIRTFTHPLQLPGNKNYPISYGAEPPKTHEPIKASPQSLPLPFFYYYW